MAMRWYVVHAYSGYEKKVAAALKERIELHGMQDRFGDVLVPTEEVVEMRGGQKRRSERKFFPGYVLVQMELEDATWHLVKETPRVMGFIGGKADAPAPITEAEAEADISLIDRYVDHLRAVRPHLRAHESYICADGGLACTKFLDGVCALDCHVIGKLRQVADGRKGQDRRRFDVRAIDGVRGTPDHKEGQA